jgi:hypothetical protein
MLRNVRLLFAKELLGAVRDRRTLFLTVLFPLIFYPLVLSVMSRFGEAERTRIETLVPTVLVVNQADDDTFAQELAQTDAFSVVSYRVFDDALADLEDDFGQILMTVDKESGGDGLGLQVVLYYDQTDQFTAIAAGRVREFLEEYLKRVVNNKLQQLGQPSFDDLTPPLSVSVQDVATGESFGRLILSRLLPYFMVLAILTGAMGLGAEVTAGEKERNTIATLLVSQLSRTEIVLGKFLAVLAVSLISSLLSAIGLMIGIRFFGGGLVPTGAAGSAIFQLDLYAFGDHRRELRAQSERSEHVSASDLHGDRPRRDDVDDRERHVPWDPIPDPGRQRALRAASDHRRRRRRDGHPAYAQCQRRLRRHPDRRRRPPVQTRSRPVPQLDPQATCVEPPTPEGLPPRIWYA